MMSMEAVEHTLEYVRKKWTYTLPTNNCVLTKDVDCIYVPKNKNQFSWDSSKDSRRCASICCVVPGFKLAPSTKRMTIVADVGVKMRQDRMQTQARFDPAACVFFHMHSTIANVLENAGSKRDLILFNLFYFLSGPKGITEECGTATYIQR